MIMLKRFVIVGAVFAAAVVMLSALAPSASAEEAQRGDVFLRGAGVLDARGDGLAALKGRMNLDVSADAGVLLVMDIGGDAEVDVSGHGDTAEWRGFTAYFGFDGEAEISGSTAVTQDREYRLYAHGEGKDYHLDITAAHARVEVMRKAKIASHERAIKALRVLAAARPRARNPAGRQLSRTPAPCRATSHAAQSRRHGGKLPPRCPRRGTSSAAGPPDCYRT